MSGSPQTPSLAVRPLPDYEMKLLTALAYFLGQTVEGQARACLSMYLRQSEPRIMAQVNYYAQKISRQTEQSLEAYDLLELIATAPEQVDALLPDLPKVHAQPDQASHLPPEP